MATPTFRILLAEVIHTKKYRDMTQPKTDIVDEFRSILNDAAAVFGIARSGLPIVARQLTQLAEMTSMKPVDLIHLAATGNTTADGPSNAFAAWPLKQLPAALSNDGVIARTIGHQWVVHVYHLWENHYRSEIAAARGLNDRNELRNQHMADLAKIRHDILKHRGVASSRNSGKCIRLKWFTEGDEIQIEDWMVYEFMEAFGVAYPASGGVDPERIIYRFQGLMQSPIRLRADASHEDFLIGDIRSLSGHPLDVERLRALIRGAQFDLAGPGGEGSATGIEVLADAENERVATLIVQAPRAFVRKVRDGSATADLPLGAQIPRVVSRKAVSVRWNRGSVLVAEATAPANHWYDLEIYEQQVGVWLPLVSDIGDLYEGQLQSVEHDPQERRTLRLFLKVSADLANAVERKACLLRLPLDLPDT